MTGESGDFGAETATLPVLLEAYGDPASVAADGDGAAARGWGEKIAALVGSAGESLGVPCLGAGRELLQWLARDLLAARREVQRIERELAQQVTGAPVLVRMAHGVGGGAGGGGGFPAGLPDGGQLSEGVGAEPQGAQ